MMVEGMITEKEARLQRIERQARLALDELAEHIRSERSQGLRAQIEILKRRLDELSLEREAGAARRIDQMDRERRQKLAAFKRQQQRPRSPMEVFKDYDGGEVKLNVDYTNYTEDELDDIFTYHAPKGIQPEVFEQFRNKGKELAAIINRRAYPCAELVSAINSLQEAIMWANAAIARHGARQEF